MRRVLYPSLTPRIPIPFLSRFSDVSCGAMLVIWKARRSSRKALLPMRLPARLISLSSLTLFSKQRRVNCLNPFSPMLLFGIDRLQRLGQGTVRIASHSRVQFFSPNSDSLSPCCVIQWKVVICLRIPSEKREQSRFDISMEL